MRTKFSRFARVLALLFSLAQVSRAAQFSVGAILQAGGPGSSGYEIGAGTNAASPVNTNDDAPYWQDGLSQQFDIAYVWATNTLTVRLFANGSTTLFNSVSYTPAASAPAVNSTWIIPAASFFVQALIGPNSSTAITISGLALSGVNGALNILSPIQQTSLQATHNVGNPSTVVAESQDVVFQADPTRSWQLSGFMTLNGLSGPMGNQLAFAVSASVTPEPAGGLLSLTGLAAGFAYLKWRKQFVSRGGACG
jgi:hypothetical protein